MEEVAREADKCNTVEEYCIKLSDTIVNTVTKQSGKTSTTNTLEKGRHGGGQKY